MPEKTIVSFFQEDHDRLENLFKQFQANKNSNFDKAKPFFRDFFQGLRRHIGWEEEILFPLFEAKTGMRDSGPTAVMRFEHEKIKQLLDQIHERVRARDSKSDPEETELLGVLGEHNMKEESILYPAIDQLLSPEEKKDAFRKIETYPEDKSRSCCGL